MMFPTVSCPATLPPYVITHGSVTPCLASLRIVLTIIRYGPRLDWYSGVSGLVGSHGRSHSALRTRVARQAAASLVISGRRATGDLSRLDSVSVTGQPRAYAIALSSRLRRSARYLDHAEPAQIGHGAASGERQLGWLARVISAAGLIYGMLHNASQDRHPVPHAAC